MDVELIRRILEESNFKILKQVRYKNCGYRIKLSNGSAVICYDIGSYSCIGKSKTELEELLNQKVPKTMFNKKVFVVYGHDEIALLQIESLLQRWNLEPLVLNSLPTQGRTVIEQLEQYIPQANFGIVLITPDDIGYSKEESGSKMFRARQNVVLELGMLLTKLGRSRVAILIKDAENIELPSDIHGILYYAYNETVEEIESKLFCEIKKNGYNTVA